MSGTDFLGHSRLSGTYLPVILSSNTGFSEIVGAQIPDLSGAVQGRISALRPSGPGTTSPAARLLGEVKLVGSQPLAPPEFHPWTRASFNHRWPHAPPGM